MRSRHSITWIALIALVVTGLTVVSPAEAQRRSAMQVGPHCIGGLQALFDEIEPVELYEDEALALLYLLEEEKLARDVYTQLATRWQLPIFTNIASAEQRHMDLVLRVFEIYQLERPASLETAGQFDDPALTAMYEQLIFEGGVENDAASLSDALRVGVEIEDMDLFDLYEMLQATDNDILEMVIHNLAKGSRNHLRAFMRALEAQGGTYEPGDYLSEEEFFAIFNSETERRMYYTAEGEPVPACGAAFGGFGLRRGSGDGQGQGNGPRGPNGDGTAECDESGSGGGTGECDGTGPHGGTNGGNGSGTGGDN